ncbi:STAS/SEC14 domain-containing protein [Salsuginibacillus kocurii]|uniref:STAS/SEC14 domain-containing protein n=1 Tax=Salsuginibacillus kocurii TaxID=427078 RepID=UPI0003621241|nr:STAS/SEC14 domain-containing protein [Salsuginibacillus kocurii]
MIERLDESTGSILAYQVVGQLTEEDYQQLTDDVQNIVQEEGEVRLLMHLPELPTTELRTIDDRLRFAREHVGNIHKVALIGDQRLVDWGASIYDSTLGIDVKHFTDEQQNEAWEWLKSEEEE